MSEPYIGEIKMFAGNFAPRNWAFCDGQLLAIAQNNALFSLLGTTYGGDGRTTFALPDLRGRVPIHQGTGPGLASKTLGSRSGSETVTLTGGQLPAHTHGFLASTGPGTQSNPVGALPGASSSVDLYLEEDPTVDLNTAAMTSVGSNQSHNNVQPFRCVNFIIALFGIYPSRN
jgi:microcystin-dependent protein